MQREVHLPINLLDDKGQSPRFLLLQDEGYACFLGLVKRANGILEEKIMFGDCSTCILCPTSWYLKKTRLLSTVKQCFTQKHGEELGNLWFLVCAIDTVGSFNTHTECVIVGTHK